MMSLLCLFSFLIIIGSIGGHQGPWKYENAVPLSPLPLPQYFDVHEAGTPATLKEPDANTPSGAFRQRQIPLSKKSLTSPCFFTAVMHLAPTLVAELPSIDTPSHSVPHLMELPSPAIVRRLHQVKLTSQIPFIYACILLLCGI
jgi:hypothetical protein